MNAWDVGEESFYAFCVMFDGWQVEMGQIVHLSAVSKGSPVNVK